METNTFKCSTCKETIGDHQQKNAVYFCDRLVTTAYCGACFNETPCGKGDHGEGCSTLMICEAAQ